ncbi:MAG TPA: MFS transporter [Methylocella sp.]|nr:MFS transporter [Methylocella sp.]
MLGPRRGVPSRGLLYVFRNIVQAAAPYPAGAVADRYGQRNILAAGYALGVLAATLTALAFASGAGSLALLAPVFFVAGLCAAVQEALESTVTAEMVSPSMLAMSYGALGTVNGATKFVSSTAVGLLWSAMSPAFSFAAAAILMAAGTIALIRLR